MVSEGYEIRIRDIQGRDHFSPLGGQFVSMVPGIVTGVRSNGFYIQDPEPDDDNATSEGIFIATGSTPTVSVGDSVLIDGDVVELRPGGANTDNLSVTQILNPSIAVVSSGNPLPTPVIIGVGGRLQPTEVIEDDAINGSVEIPGSIFDSDQDGIDFYESLEGMRVQVNNAVATDATTGFGEIFVLADNGALASGRNPRGGITIDPDDFNPERIQIDDESIGLLSPEASPQVNVGDQLGNVTGILDYNFGNFELLFTSPITVTSGGLEPEISALKADADNLLIAAYNVLNLDPVDDPADPTDGPVQLNALAAQIVNNLNSPDIIALQEIQDNNGAPPPPIAADSSVVDGTETLLALIDAIEAAGGPRYEFREVSPVVNTTGGEPGGNIRNAYLYNPARVDYVDRTIPGAFLFVDSTEVIQDETGAKVSLSPGFVDPGNPAFDASRPPLVGEFVFNGNQVFLLNNHFTSRVGSDPLFGRFQPAIPAGDEERQAQAAVVNEFVDDLLAADPEAKIVVLGDFNEFQFLPALQILAGNVDGEVPVLVNLTNTLPDSERYTFLFEGNSQTLDHIFVSNNLFASAEYDIVHVNAEFVDQASDHDPVLARLLLPGEPTPEDTPTSVEPLEPEVIVGVSIHDIQGAAHFSPLGGRTVAEVAGIVTGVTSSGFYMQDPEPDNDNATSEGIFVSTGSAPTVAVGDAVLVDGDVAEIRPGGANSGNLTVTQILNPTITVESSGNPLPAPTIIGVGGRLQPTEIFSDDAVNGNVEAPGSTFDPSQDGLDFYESLEGMVVQVNNALAIDATFNPGGQIVALADSGLLSTARNSRGGVTIGPSDANPERLFIDDASVGTLSPAPTPVVGVGDRLGTITGILDFDAGEYEIQLSSEITVTPSSLQPEITTLQGDEDTLLIAAYNVLNLDGFDDPADPEDGPEQFSELAVQIVNNLNTPDIIALQEIQDNDGAPPPPIAADSSIVDASETLQTLVDAIAAAGGPQYEFFQIDVIVNESGGEPGGNIRNAYLYNPERVDLVERTIPGANLSVDSTAVIQDESGAKLSLSPGFIDPGNPAFNASRVPLAAEFEFAGNQLFLVNNHFTSRGGSDPFFGRFQPIEAGGQAQREAQAAVNNAFVDDILAADPNANVIVLGDFNEFWFLPALQILTGNVDGEVPVLTNLTNTLPENERYSFITDGNGVSLDHIVVSNNLFPRSAYDIVHVNAEFSDPASDHEPVLAAIDFPVSGSSIGGTPVITDVFPTDIAGTFLTGQVPPDLPVDQLNAA